MRSRHVRHTKMILKKRLLIILIIILGIAIIIDFQLRPVIKTVAASQAKIISTNAINEAVSEELLREDINYSNLISTQRNNDGKVLAITTNMKSVNLLKSHVGTAIQKKICQKRVREVHIPLGTLTNTEILNGKGPLVPLTITLSGNVLTEFKSSFVTAGINQTKHQIYLNIKTNIYALIPGYPVTTAVDTNIVISETVIVGDVPNVFANTDSQKTSTIADLAQLNH